MRDASKPKLTITQQQCIDVLVAGASSHTVKMMSAPAICEEALVEPPSPTDLCSSDIGYEPSPRRPCLRQEPDGASYIRFAEALADLAVAGYVQAVEVRGRLCYTLDPDRLVELIGTEAAPPWQDRDSGDWSLITSF